MFIRFDVGTNSNKLQAALKEVCKHFEGNSRSDAYQESLVRELATANESLFGAVYIAMVKQGVEQEARQVNKQIASARNFVESFIHDADPEVQASARLIKRQFSMYGKPFALMPVYDRITAVSAFLRDLEAPDFQTHVAKVPGLRKRLDDIGEALNALSAKKLEVDEANSKAPEGQPLVPLKHEAVAKANRLLDYLRTMADKEPDLYGEHYKVVTEILTDLKSSRRSKATKKAVELESGKHPRQNRHF